MMYLVVVILLVLKLILIVWLRKEKNKRELIEKKAQALLYAIDLSTTSLWIPNLEQTEDCVMLHGTGFLSDPDEEESYGEYPGITNEINELVKAINNY